jgi:hypothetical protein
MFVPTLKYCIKRCKSISWIGSNKLEVRSKRSWKQVEFCVLPVLAESLVLPSVAPSMEGSDDRLNKYRALASRLCKGGKK